MRARKPHGQNQSVTGPNKVGKKQRGMMGEEREECAISTLLQCLNCISFTHTPKEKSVPPPLSQSGTKISREGSYLSWHLFSLPPMLISISAR